jgi:hypothetical protein
MVSPRARGRRGVARLATPRAGTRVARRASMRKLVVVAALVAACKDTPSVPDEYKAFVPTDGLHTVMPYDGAMRRADVGLWYERDSVDLQKLHDAFVERLRADASRVPILDCSDGMDKKGFVVIYVDKARATMFSVGGRNLTDKTIDATLSTQLVGMDLPTDCAWLPAAKSVCDADYFPRSCRIHRRAG